MTKKLTPFTLPSSGVTIQTIPISFLAILDSLKREPEWSEPEPPIVAVEIGGEKTYERNWADPDYATAKRIWAARVDEEATHRLLRRIAITQTLNDEQLAEVRELREALNEPGLHPNDKVLWLYEHAIGDDADVKALIQFVTAQIDPQENNVKKKPRASGSS
jgi:hypothetical protein